MQRILAFSSLQIAPGKEVLVAVANKNTQWDGMLDTFMKGIRSTKVENHLILALDVETKVGPL